MNILPQLLLNALITGSIYALASVGFSLTFLVTKTFNFAHGHLLMLGAYIFYWANVQLGLSFFPAVGFTLLFMLAVSLLSFRVFLAPFYRLNFLLPIITTLALATIIESLVSLKFGVTVKSLVPGFANTPFDVWHITVTPVELIIIGSTLLLLSFLAFMIHSSSFGRKMRALSQNQEAAVSLGINDQRFVVGLFIIGVLLAAYGGVAVGYYTNLQPTMGNLYTIRSFAALVLGGLGNIWGTLAGAYILGLVENLSLGLDLGAYSIPAGYKDAFAFFIIFFVLLFRPEGLFQRRGRKV